MGYGIDVSCYQGKIDWLKVAKDGIRFAILKATYKDNTIESSFYTNYNGCIKNGIKVGCYRYVYAKTVSQAEEEAEALVTVMKNKDIVCGVWLDMEDSSLLNLSKAELSNIIETEAEILREAGYSVGIYCNKNWYYNVLDSTKLKKEYPFWIARYPDNDEGKLVQDISPRLFSVAWQYSQCGKVDGIKGNVDLDYSYTDLSKKMGHAKTLTKRISAYRNMSTLNKPISFIAKGSKVKVIGTSKGKGFCKVIAKTVSGKTVTCYVLRKYLK